jgi:hypothetical protein
MRYGGNLCPEKSVAMAQGFEERKRLTFEQAEGAEPLPSQLKPKELLKELRALLFEAIWLSMKGGLYIDDEMFGDWRDIAYDFHVLRRFRPADEFENSHSNFTYFLK